MDKNQLIKTFKESPSIKLLKSRNGEFILSFLMDVFQKHTTLLSERLHQLLENQLDNIDIDLEYEEEEESRPNRIETNEEKARRWIQDWTNKGFLTNYQNESGEIIYEMSSYTSKAIDWIESLKKEDYIGTESKFKSIFNQLKELVEFSNEDREKRLAILKEKKLEIEHQIQQLEIGENIKVYEEYEIVPRYNSLNKLAKELLSDFKEVDDNFKEIIRQIYQRQMNNSLKKDLLNYFFDAYSELKHSSQGKSFYAFWEYLLSPSLQEEWEAATNALFETLEAKHIDTQDNFLKNMQQHLYAAGEKVYKTNSRMSEKLSKIIRQNELTNAEITRRIIDDLKKMLMDTRMKEERPDIAFEVDEFNLHLPIERPLSFEPSADIEYTDKPEQAQLHLDDLDRLTQLFHPYQIDKTVLRHRINKVLANKAQTTLQEVISRHHGITKGLAEVIGYISVLKEYHTLKNPEKMQTIVFSKEDQRVILIPEIIITR